MRTVNGRAVLLVLGALACFAAGIAAARSMGPAPQRAPKEPQIMVDTSSIRLLPDASLKLDLPPALDAGTRGPKLDRSP